MAPPGRGDAALQRHGAELVEQRRSLAHDLSVPVASSTAPNERAMWLDPGLLPRLAGRRTLLVDDVISTGSFGLALLARPGVRPVALAVAMAQGDRWRPAWPGDVPVVATFAKPLLRRFPGGVWAPRPGTAPHDLCPSEPR